MSAKKKFIADSYNGEPPKTLDDHPFYGYVLDDEQKNFINSVWDKEKLIIFCNAKAGTGKTFLATGVADMLVKYGLYEGIVYIVSTYGENRQGYLPGTITEKSEVYFEPFYQALISCDINPNIAINDESMVNQKNGTGYVTCLTHTFLRGTNFEKKVIIIDEAQNFKLDELKKTLTRCADSCKVICIGHDKQCDIEDANKSGFVKYIEHLKEKPWACVCNLTKNYRGKISQWADEL